MYNEPQRNGLYLRTLREAALLRHEVDGSESVLVEPSKLLALVVYLACSPGRTATRDGLIDLLWSDLEPEAGRHALRQHLWQLKKRVGDELLVEGRDQLVLKSSLDSDRTRFIAASENSDFTSAIRIYTGDFFPSFAASGAVEFEHWVENERADLRSRFVRCADVVVRDLLNAHRHREAVQLAQRIRSTDPLRQHGWRQLIETLVATGDVLSAKVECEALDRLVVHERMELEPATKNLVAAVRQTGDVGRSDRGPQTLVTELVGREKEFAALMQSWDAVCRGRTRRVHVMAQAGLGKTRLLAEFRARLKSLRARSVLVRGNSGTATVPYALVSDLAERLGRLPGAAGVSPHSMQILVALSPALSSVFRAAPLTSRDADSARHRLVALRELIACVASEQPLAILVDDMHWADEPSRSLLAGLGAEFDEEIPLLCCTASRGNEIASRQSYDNIILLEPLSEPSVLSLIASIATLPNETWTDQLVVELFRRTRGIPLYLVESLQQALQEGLLAIRDGSWSCARPVLLWEMFAAGGVLRRRLDQLDGDERQVLQTIAVAAAPVDERVVCAASGLLDENAARALASLRQKGLLSTASTGVGTLHDEIIVLALEDTPPEARAEIERRLGTVLAAVPYLESRLRRRAATLLSRSNAREELVELFRTHLADSRRHRDGRPSGAIAADLLGSEASELRVRELTQSVPLLDRFRASRLARLTVAASIAFGIAGSAFGFAMMWRGARQHPEAVLHVTLRPQEGGTITVAARLFSDAWDANVPIVIDGKRNVVLRAQHTFTRPPIVAPDGKTWVADTEVPDSGVTDLFLLTDGGRRERRLTFTRGDDLHASWSPDGRLIVFSTTRWDSLGHTDLAVMTLQTGEVRQLTSGASSDLRARWGPDGTLIAFHRFNFDSTGSQVCIVRPDGTGQGCKETGSSTNGGLAGWDSESSFVTREGTDATHGSVRYMIVGAEIRSDGAWTEDALEVSAGSRWFADFCSIPDVSGPYCVYQPKLAPQPRRVTLDPQVLLSGVQFSSELGIPYLDRLKVGNSHATVVIGVPFELEVEGFDQRGSPARIPAFQARVLNEELGFVDSTGALVAHQAGRMAVEVSAGGWRADTVVFVVEPASDTPLLVSDWSALAPWRAFGEPAALLIDGEGGGRALHLAGDGVYHSGAYLDQVTDGRRGLSVHARVSTPITATQWQQLTISMTTKVDRTALATWNHRSGYLWGAPGVGYSQSCEAHFPLPDEKPHSADSVQLGGRHSTGSVVMSTANRRGRWYEMVLQLFPDGHCGLAIDGKVVGMTGPGPLELNDVLVSIFGNSVGTRILVGKVEVRQGVLKAIDWSKAQRSSQ